MKKIPSVANGGPTGLDGLAQVGEEGPGGHLSCSETMLAASFGALGGGNGNRSADSGFPSASEYRCAVLKKESLGHYTSSLVFTSGSDTILIGLRQSGAGTPNSNQHCCSVLTAFN